MTEIPGQTMLDEDNPGNSLLIARELAKRAGFSFEEVFVPWGRAVNNTENGSRSFIIPFSRTPEREDRFIWVAPLFDMTFGFVSLETQYNDKASAKELNRIGVWRGTSMEEELMVEGFSNLVPVSNDKALVRMLIGGRLDAWYGSIAEAKFMFSGIEIINRKKIRFGMPIKSSPVWLAAGHDTENSVIQKARKALNAMHADGFINDVLSSQDAEFQ